MPQKEEQIKGIKKPETPDDEGFFETYIGDPYKETVGSIEGLKMLAHMAALGSLGAGAGHFGSKLLTPGMKRKLPGAKRKTEGTFTSLGALVGAGLGAYTGSRGLDYSSASNLMKSLFQRDYWKKNPEQLQKTIQKHRQEIAGMEYAPQYQLFNDPKKYVQNSVQKSGQEDDKDSISGFVPSVDINESKDVINEDPYMHPFGKQKTNEILDKSDEDDNDGWSSQFDIGDAALQLGAGFAPSYAAGRVMGGLMRLPKSTKKRLSLTGGLAGAIANTGVLDEL